MYLLYTLLLSAAVLLYSPVYLFRVRVLRKEKVFLRERLGRGLLPRTGAAEAVWIHAVSVGEVLSLQNLVRELRRRHPEWPIVFSTLTNGGLRMARDKLREADRVFLLPLDFPSAVRRVFRALRPACLVLAESEFWPNLLRAARRRTRGVLLVNGRISESTHKKYSEVRPLARRMLRDVDRFLVQTGPDRERLEDIGVDPARIEVAGNLKCEVDLPRFGPEDLRAFRASLGLPEGCGVVVAGSTRKGEEERLLGAYAAARRSRADLRLVLAPRHVERAAEAERLAAGLGLRTARRTALGPNPEAGGWDVLVLDTLGELARTYALSDAAFVGGSLVDWGGHNLLEPAFYGKPVFFGPHMHNFAALAESFLGADAARTTRTDEDLTAMFLAAGDADLAAMGGRAKAHLESLAGATDRAVRAIERLMDRQGAAGSGSLVSDPRKRG